MGEKRTSQRLKSSVSLTSFSMRKYTGGPDMVRFEQIAQAGLLEAL